MPNPDRTARDLVRRAIDAFIDVYNPDAGPFDWTQNSTYQVSLE